MTNETAGISAEEEVSYVVGGQSGMDAIGYDPEMPVYRTHQQLELAAICICNGLSILIIAMRIYIRAFKIKRKFHADDIWIIAAGILLIFPHFTCQLGANHFGSGLHLYNVTNSMMKNYWVFSWGYCGYYIVCSLIKVSQCCCLLQILPDHLKTFRRGIYLLCATILSLGLSETLIWLFQCKPLLSNFVYDISQDSCVNLDPVRYSWVGLSVPIDLIIIYIPFGIIQCTQLRRHEKRALYLVFAANMLGTVACALGAYGIFSNRHAKDSDFTYTETAFIITNDIEILLYTLGASFPVLSPYFISYCAPSITKQTPTSASMMPSWRRQLSESRIGRMISPTTTIGRKRTRSFGTPPGRSRDVEMLDSTIAVTGLNSALEITVDWQVSVEEQNGDLEKGEKTAVQVMEQGACTDDDEVGSSSMTRAGGDLGLREKEFCI